MLQQIYANVTVELLRDFQLKGISNENILVELACQLRFCVECFGIVLYYFAINIHYLGISGKITLPVKTRFTMLNDYVYL